MILTEYDEKKHFRTLFREGKEEGIKEGMEKGIEIGLTRGREENRRELVRKKLAKGKPVPAIAEELEEDVSVIEEIVNDLNA